MHASINYMQVSLYVAKRTKFHRTIGLLRETWALVGVAMSNNLIICLDSLLIVAT